VASSCQVRCACSELLYTSTAHVLNKASYFVYLLSARGTASVIYAEACPNINQLRNGSNIVIF
jgi:hypothetical protein